MSISFPDITSAPSMGPIGPVHPTSPARNDAIDEGFGRLLSNAMNKVNDANSGAQQQIGSLLAGHDTDLSSVMVSVEKADVAFQLALQVRNKIVNAYQDIEKMQF